MKKMDLFADKLKHARKLQGYTQTELCKKVNQELARNKFPSITRNAITMYETGERRPKYEVLIALSRVLKTDANDLLGIQEGDLITHKIRYDELDIEQKRLFDMMPSNEQEKYLEELSLEKKLNNVCDKIIDLCRYEGISISEFEELINKLQIRQSLVKQQTLVNTKV